MLTQFSRTELLLGKEAMNKLEGARVAVFGIGGVGGCCRRVGEYGQADGAKLRGFDANFIVQIGQVCVQIGHFAKGKIVQIGHHFRVSH